MTDDEIQVEVDNIRHFCTREIHARGAEYEFAREIGISRCTLQNLRRENRGLNVFTLINILSRPGKRLVIMDGGDLDG